MRTKDFDYELPEELIAQTPVEPRDSSRMMVCNRNDNQREGRIFRNITEYLRPGDVMVINQTRVIPARLLGVKESTGVPTEFLLLKRQDKDTWEALVKPGRRLHAGDTVSFGDGLLRAEIIDNTDAGGRLVRFIYEGVFENLLEKLGEMPLPPYIHEKLEDLNRYQTVYAKLDGSAAAPTAGLHFTPELLKKVEEMGVTVSGRSRKTTWIITSCTASSTRLRKKRRKRSIPPAKTVAGCFASARLPCVPSKRQRMKRGLCTRAAA